MTPELRNGPDLIDLFTVGFEGGAEWVRACADANDDPRVWCATQSLALDENDDEYIYYATEEMPDFDAYWQQFTSQKDWYCFIPSFIHLRVKPLVAASVGALATRPARQNRRAERFIAIAVQRWQAAVADPTTNWSRL